LGSVGARGWGLATALVAPIVVAAAGCIVGIASPLPDTGDGGGAEGGGDAPAGGETGGPKGGQLPDGAVADHGAPVVEAGPIFDGGSPEGGGGEASCSPDLSTDPGNCGRCGHACDTGSCTGGTCAPKSLRAGGGAITSLRIVGTTLYWMEGQAGVYACALPGCTSVTTIVDGTHLEGYAVADRAYVVEGYAESGAVMRAYALDGSKSSQDLTISLVGMTGPVDTDSTSVLFTTNDDAGVPFFGYLPQDAASWQGVYIIVYLVNPQVDLRVKTLGGTEYAFWTETDRLSRSLTVGDATPVRLASGNGVRGLAVDATYVFWAAEGDGTVSRCDALAPDCSGAKTLLSGQAGPSRVVVDATGIAWANRGTGGNGAIAECAYPDCTAPFLLAQGESTPDELAMDGTYVYWATGSTIWRVPR
jgi:hypothetical protein